ncbi:MAG TPA: 16S rRNA (adenine(1518)-N(6)/adenine(1519)-N(6))-dimethyltransferase RsmA [Candidatus Saccharimonadales bacterium]|nr:16S rRNA (adenine(1518)-N(6)/adenine(1519)-N(6))-dimethyltransferase RsmA [Candidatus Saccharimonadales bacterium]
MPEPAPKKSLGQHWLTDPATLTAIADAAELHSDDTILEIGPGLGSLTSELLARVGHVVAVEFDAELARKLSANPKLEVVHQDILQFDFTEVEAPYKIVANIPYYLTSNLLRVLSETPNPAQLAVLLMQKEVAERVAAKPGAMSLLSVSVQFYWQTELGRKVPAELFTPPPQVDSQVLILRYRTQPLFPDVDEKKFFHLVKAGFAQRRKTLLNSLSSGLHLSRQETIDLCAAANIDPARRAQTLSLEEWHQLYLAHNT